MNEVNFENMDNNAQYQSFKAAIKAHAEEYSFNIESMLFPQLTNEQQKLWRKEIEQACISGGDAGVSLVRDFIKKDAFIEKACEFLKDRIEHDSIDYPMATKHLVEDFKKYMEE